MNKEDSDYVYESDDEYTSDEEYYQELNDLDIIPKVSIERDTWLDLYLANQEPTVVCNII